MPVPQLLRLAGLADVTPAAWRGRITAGMSSAVFLGQVPSPLVLSLPTPRPALGFVWGAALAGVVGLALFAQSLVGRKESADGVSAGQPPDLLRDGQTHRDERMRPEQRNTS